MLVKLNKDVERTEEGAKISDVLNVTDEQLVQFQEELEEITQGVVNAMIGEESAFKNTDEVLNRLNELSPEALLYGSLCAIQHIASITVQMNPFEQMMGQLRGDDDDTQPEDDVKVIQLVPETDPTLKPAA